MGLTLLANLSEQVNSSYPKWVEEHKWRKHSIFNTSYYCSTK